MSNKLILYNIDLSPPCRSVKIVCKLIGVDLEIRDIDFQNGEHLKEDYLKINPEHTVPTLNENGKILSDSHAICCYLIDKYAKDDSLYPKDLYQRARCNQRLHFDNGILFQRLKACSAVIYGGGTVVPDDKIAALYQAYDSLEAFLATDLYLVGNSLTVADICAMTSVTSMDAVYAPIIPEKLPKLSAWLERIKQLPFYDDMNGKFVIQYKQFLAEKIVKNGCK